MSWDDPKSSSAASWQSHMITTNHYISGHVLHFET